MGRFQEALVLDPALDLDPEAEAHRLAALGLVDEGGRLAREGDVEGAIARYTAAQTLDPTYKIGADSWNRLCRFGSLWGYASEVLDACERAVKLDPNHGEIRDSRGLARALTGDYEGAIEDFKFFVAWSEDRDSGAHNALLRISWIAELEDGRNPFDSAILEALRGE